MPCDRREDVKATLNTSDQTHKQPITEWIKTQPKNCEPGWNLPTMPYVIAWDPNTHTIGNNAANKTDTQKQPVSKLKPNRAVNHIPLNPAVKAAAWCHDTHTHTHTNPFHMINRLYLLKNTQYSLSPWRDSERYCSCHFLHKMNVFFI